MDGPPTPGLGALLVFLTLISVKFCSQTGCKAFLIRSIGL